MNELRVDVTPNTLGRIRYFLFYDCIDIILDQWPYDNKLIQVSLTTHSNIYRASFALIFAFIKFKASPEGLQTDVFDGRFSERVAYWITGLRYCDQIRMFSVQTTLGTQPGLGN